MPLLNEILKANFYQYTCLLCQLSWWLGKNFEPNKCPFRGHEMKYIRNNFKPISRVIELPEQLSSDELGNIFTKYKE